MSGRASGRQPALSGTFTPAGSLAGARDGHTALPLPDGRVLIVGGDAGGADPPAAMAEIWEPATVGFGPAAALPAERQSYDAVLVDDGRVLLVGGFTVAGDDLVPAAQAELWDPATGAVEPAGSLAAGRWGHTTTRLPDGRVLVTSGQDWDHMLASAEVWSPAPLTFEPAGAFVPARHSHTATMLPDGRVLIVGGWDPDGLGKGLAVAEVWAPGDA
ncbi:MAG: kelch repeat-containing protein [Candidatus Limnocylindrales bacterium]